MTDMIPSLVVFSACVGAVLVLPKIAHYYTSEDGGKQRWGFDRFARGLRVRDMQIKYEKREREQKSKYVNKNALYLEQCDKLVKQQ